MDTQAVKNALWTDVNGIRLAELIDRAKGIMAEENRDWIAEDRIQKKTQQYLEEGFRSCLGGKVCQLHAGGICGNLSQIAICV